MILGLGIDALDIRRIEKTIERFGTRFTHRVFTPTERERARGRANETGALAMRFSAKEACAKALGTGIDHGVFWRDMEVFNLASGKPAMRLEGEARARLLGMVPEGMSPRIDVSMADEHPLAQAMVIISAVSPGSGQ